MKLKNLYKIIMVIKDIYDLDEWLFFAVLILLIFQSWGLNVIIGGFLYLSYEAWFSDEDTAYDNLRKIKEAWYYDKTKNTRESQKSPGN